MGYKYNDGGRSKTRKGNSSDCSVRAIAIAVDMEYEECYKLCKQHGFTPKSGMMREDFDTVLKKQGWKWVPYKAVKGMPRVKLHELQGTCIASVSRHLVAVVDGVVNDNHDCRRLPEGRAVYGIWTKG